MFDAALIADEAEPLIDEEASDCPGRHTLSSDTRKPETISDTLRTRPDERTHAPWEAGGPARVGKARPV
jgi:hypothetical protein